MRNICWMNNVSKKCEIVCKMYIVKIENKKYMPEEKLLTWRINFYIN